MITGYDDDKPSISLIGLIPDALGDVISPPRGRGVAVSDLRDLDARRRFGEFGRKFVSLERLRQGRRVERTTLVSGNESDTKTFPSTKTEYESLRERRCVTRQLAGMHNVNFSAVTG